MYKSPVRDFIWWVHKSFVRCALDSAAPWTAAHQAPLSLEFSGQDYWSGLPFSTPGDLPVPGIELLPHVSCVSCIGKWVLYH